MQNAQFRSERAALLAWPIECSAPAEHHAQQCGEDHSWIPPVDPYKDLLDYVLTGTGASGSAPWITRIKGDSANGYEYVCSYCVMAYEFEADEWEAEYEAEEQRKWEERHTI